MALRITTFSIMTLGIIVKVKLFLLLCWAPLWRVSFMLSTITLSAIMLNVSMLNVVMMSVMALPGEPSSTNTFSSIILEFRLATVLECEKNVFHF
jgi:hypothetical protein